MNVRPLWQPDPYVEPHTHLHAFCAQLARRLGYGFANYAALHAWSVAERGRFWAEVWDYCGVIGKRGEEVLVEEAAMWSASWFPQARLNFAQNLLRIRDEREALIFRGEDSVRRRMSHAELYREVARCAAALKQAGVVQGDRVVAYMPNLPETVILMLASASIGAIFSSASPDFGVEGVIDRFGQITPSLLVAADGALYDGKRIEVLEKLAQIVARLPSLNRVVVLPYIHCEVDCRPIPHACSWASFLAPHQAVNEIDFAELPFAHPLYILYSSGTTGVPKCIVHGAGGTLLQHLKEQRLHCDLRAGDRLFYYTTCGWMMWNWLVSGLASGAALLLYDGAPFAAEGNVLWDYARDERCTHFGVSAKFIDAAAKLGLRPMESHDLTSLRILMSTGSPLAPEGFDYVYQDVKRDVCLASISGGTDIVSCFVLGNPLLPVWRGEIQCKGLGMDVAVWNEAGDAVRGERGELVCKTAFPSMPLAFWNDPEGRRYHAAYFERFDGVWCHGDWCEETVHDGLVIYGRSDATLNPGGVRIGTAEIYRQVERLPEVLESLVIGQDWDHDVRTVLFVRLREGLTLGGKLEALIRQTIRENLSPRHVPGRIVQVTDIPRTRSGKLVELAVRAVVHGQPVRNIEALANPEALEFFRNRSELKA
ncbi:acetoacetate--CoA ligase [Uliginosibacterium aquaticum]|uniref:Acetoacetate--CoA ligase n=1 Tax=Uliginosibacterium aquaticum TaxID=2731212 RepID=A0ABX2IRJ6_9RHOO|nr:acetoacetate--CoA ligase [Uliginosibacterium aquaticum]NSL56843.1 acetoacetate--CoA ligase [Uliginosibacterium aquaticum]